MRRNKLFTFFGNLDAYIAVAGMGVLVLLSFFGVIMRYFINRPISWQEEVMVLLLLWIVFFGASFCFRQKSHIAIDLLIDLLPPWAQRLAGVGVQLVVIVVLAYLGYYGYRACLHYDRLQNATNILKVPYSLKYLAVPVGCVLMILSSSWRLIMELTGRLPDKPSVDGQEEEAAHV